MGIEIGSLVVKVIEDKYQVEPDAKNIDELFDADVDSEPEIMQI